MENEFIVGFLFSRGKMCLNRKNVILSLGILMRFFHRFSNQP